MKFISALQTWNKNIIWRKILMFIKKNYSSIKEKVTKIKWLTFIFIFFEKSTI